MDKEGLDYVGIGIPHIIVRKLTYEIIEETIKAYAKGDGYWFKYYALAGSVSIEELDRLKAKCDEELDLLD